MIDIQRDELLSLSQLARKLPSVFGGRLNPSTVFRWATAGLKGHKLEVVHIGARMLTTMKAYEAFAAAISAGPAPEPKRTPTPARRIGKERARKILAGI